jgi:hypothetical protein
MEAPDSIWACSGCALECALARKSPGSEMGKMSVCAATQRGPSLNALSSKVTVHRHVAADGGAGGAGSGALDRGSSETARQDRS